MEKKKKKTCPQPILLTAADRIYDGKTPLHNTVSKAALSGATLYQAHRWAEDLKPPLPPPRGLFGFVYTERIKGKTDGGGGSQLLEPCHIVVFSHLCWTTDYH